MEKTRYQAEREREQQKGGSNFKIQYPTITCWKLVLNYTAYQISKKPCIQYNFFFIF